MFFFLSACVFFLISLGPSLDLNTDSLKLPIFYTYKFGIPPFTSIRAYGRFGIFVVTIVTLSCSFIFDKLINKYVLKKQIFIVIPLLVLCFLDLLPFSQFPYYKLPIPQYIQSLQGKLKTQEYIANVPFQSAGSPFNSTAMLFQTIHQGNIINGYSSFSNNQWESKIKLSVIRCFHFLYSLDPKCNDISNINLKDERIKFLIFEKNDLESPYPAYLPGIPEADDRNLILSRVKKVAFMIVFEDKNYLIAQIY